MLHTTFLTLTLAVGCSLLNVRAIPHPPATTAASVSAAQQSYYDGKFDSIDLDELLGNERLLRNYIKCLENTGPCTPDGRMLKEILPDAVSTDCMKCTEKQKAGSNRVTKFLIDNRPEDWERLEKIYDPAGSYRLTYLQEKKQKSNDTDTNDQINEKAAMN